MTHLIDPLNNPKLNLQNRLVYPPMATAKSSEDGHVTDQLIDYYDEKSRGGYVALFIIEHSFINQQGKASAGQLSIADNSVIDSLRKLSAVIHKNSSKAVMQINHAGSAASSAVTGMNVVGPSAVPHPRHGGTPDELSVDEINNIINDFRNAALRVKEAGFDGVEIHSAHGYLLNQFYSPLTNKRTDEYGGDINNRIRIHLQIIKAVREAVGEDFTILLRLGGCDYKEGGSTLDDAKTAAIAFEKAGIDILDITGGMFGYMTSYYKNQGYFSEVTTAVKEIVSIPVILTGGITDPEKADDLISFGKTDLVGVGRAMLKDSSWAENTINELTAKING